MIRWTYNTLHRLTTNAVRVVNMEYIARPLLLLPILILAICTIYWLPPSQASVLTRKPLVRQSPKQHSSQQHVLSAAYYKINDDWNSTIMLSNQGSTRLEVQPILFSLSGERYDISPITLDKTSTQSFDLNEWVVSAGDNFRQGSIHVLYSGESLEVAGMLVMTDSTRSKIFDQELTEPKSDFRSSQLEGVWWLPGQRSEIRISLSNTTDQSVSVFIEATRQTAETLQLNPHETHLLTLFDSTDHSHQFGGTRFGGISIKHSGVPGAIIACGFVQQKSTGYSSIVEFTDPQTAKSSRLDGAGLRIKNTLSEPMKHVAVIRNIGDASTNVIVRMPYTLIDGSTSKVSLPDIQLEPREIKEIDLTRFIRHQTRNQAVDAAGIELIYTGGPGSVIGMVRSYLPRGTSVFRVMLRDANSISSSTGTYPLNLDKGFSTIVYVKNTTGDPEKFTFDITYNGGAYTLPVQTIEGGQTLEFDIRKYRDDQVPDLQGRKLPLEIANGQIHWSVKGKNVNPLIGRVELVDTANQVSMTAACHVCCPDSDVGLSISPTSAVILLDGSVQFTAYADREDCFSNPHGFYPIDSGSWSTSNPSIARVDPTGYVTGQGAGLATIQVAYHGETYTLDESINVCDMGAYDGTAQAQVTVAPRIDAIAPGQGVKGTTVGVTITGNGFGSSPTIQVAGGGITASVTSYSATSINANFSIADSATGGDHGVTVNVGGITSNSVNFYVQIPTKVGKLNFPGAPNGVGPLVTLMDGDVVDLAGMVKKTHQCGVYRNLAYELLDQAGESITQAYSITETFSNYMGPDSLPADLTINIPENGVIGDTQYFGRTAPSCPGSDDHESFNQKFIAKVGGKNYNLTTVVHISKGRFSGTYKCDVSITTP